MGEFSFLMRIAGTRFSRRNNVKGGSSKMSFCERDLGLSEIVEITVDGMVHQTTMHPTIISR